MTNQAIGLELEHDEARWSAVVDRNAAFDDQFVFAVATTEIYCRPSCPSRRANRENVSFFDTNAEAELSGFRACRRCRPDEPSQSDRNARVVERACRQIETSATEPSLDDLAHEAGLSRFHFQRMFKEIVGMTPKQYARGARSGRLREVVKKAPTVTDSAFESGHESMRGFYDNAVVAFGMTPRAFRAGAKGEVIVFASATSSIGVVTAAFTRKGICATRITENAIEGERELKNTFPAALFVRGEGEFDRLVEQVVATIEEPSRAAELPLDIRGTAFQQRVWRALQEIPIGTTSTYSEIAAAIGAPTSHRAVATACGANPVAVLVPCHRVLRADGGLAGYRWGVERKKALLEREGAD